MTRQVSRTAARVTIADAGVRTLSPAERTRLLEEWWTIDEDDQHWVLFPEDLREEIQSHDAPLSPSASPKYDPLLRVALLHETFGVTNSWLESKLNEMQDHASEVVGSPEKMLRCRCCQHLTLRERGSYEICPVCFWEDDGMRAQDVHSSPNHMTLREGIQNFTRIGACDPKMLPHVLADGRKRYPLDASLDTANQSETR